ncbi:MAG: hypothetical protein ABSD02_09755 [Steroidobacteraceae bacterium]|jgi:hypothetical protein
MKYLRVDGETSLYVKTWGTGREGAPHGLFATEKTRLTQDFLDFLKK